MPSWIQDPETGKLVPREDYLQKKRAVGTHVIGDIEPFVSPIDGSTIYTRRQLRDHNIRHGVTDMRDYGPNWFTRKTQDRSDAITGKLDRNQRIDAIQKSLYQHGVIK